MEQLKGLFSILFAHRAFISIEKYPVYSQSYPVGVKYLCPNGQKNG